MGLTGAHNLSTAAREALEEESTETVSGTLDGWVWSAAELTLIADDKGRIKVSVPMSLQERVAELNSERDTRVRGSSYFRGAGLFMLLTCALG